MILRNLPFSASQGLTSLPAAFIAKNTEEILEICVGSLLMPQCAILTTTTAEGSSGDHPVCLIL